MKTENSSELKQRLQGILSELDRLATQIRETRDLSESAELLLCLRELIHEQIEGQYRENSRITTHAAR